MRDEAQHGDFVERAARYVRLAEEIGKPYIRRPALTAVLIVGYVATLAFSYAVYRHALPQVVVMTLLGIVVTLPLLVVVVIHVTIRRRALRRAKRVDETHDGFYEFYRLWAFYPFWTSKKEASDTERMFASFAREAKGGAEAATRGPLHERRPRSS